MLTVRADRQRILPYGIARASRGTPSVNVLNPDGEARQAAIQVRASRSSRRPVPPPDRRAGGSGDPLEREPDDVARDVRNGKLSAGVRAARVSGVVLTVEDLHGGRHRPPPATAAQPAHA